MKQATIIYCLRGAEVLLGMKKRGFGVGKWNGFGGKVGEGEAIRNAAVRELAEECGLGVATGALEQVAINEFYFADKPVFECHTFFAREWRGEPQESEEMRPQWFAIAALPFESMWASDPLWLPQVFAGERLKGVFIFDEKGEGVENVRLDKLEKIV